MGFRLQSSALNWIGKINLKPTPRQTSSIITKTYKNENNLLRKPNAILQAAFKLPPLVTRFPSSYYLKFLSPPLFIFRFSSMDFYLSSFYLYSLFVYPFIYFIIVQNHSILAQFDFPKMF